MRAPCRTLLAALVLSGCVTTAHGQEPAHPAPTSPAPIAPTAPPPLWHPALGTGWARALVAGEPLRTTPAVDARAPLAIPSTQVAGRAQAIARDPDGLVWVRVAFGGGVAGWAPGESLASAPPPPGLSPRAERTLTRAMASLGSRASVVVRDPLGRTIFRWGTSAPLSIASVTKLATVNAALESRALPLRAAAAILGPSDNYRAQLLSNSVGGGSSRRGARRAVDAAATLGARFQIVDGSGLSPANRASAGEVADLLVAVRDTPGFRTLFRAMPMAARSGTLRGRMTGTPAAGRMRAKTGTLFDTPASALAGYLWPKGSGLRPDRALVVVILANRVSPYRARPVQDTIAAALAAPGALSADSVGFGVSSSESS